MGGIGPKLVDRGEYFHMSAAIALRLAARALTHHGINVSEMKQACTPVFHTLELWKYRQHDKGGNEMASGLSKEYSEQVYAVFDQQLERTIADTLPWKYLDGMSHEERVSILEEYLRFQIKMCEYEEFVQKTTAEAKERFSFNISMKVMEDSHFYNPKFTALLPYFFERVATELHMIETHPMLPEF